MGCSSGIVNTIFNAWWYKPGMLSNSSQDQKTQGCPAIRGVEEDRKPRNQNHSVRFVGSEALSWPTATPRQRGVGLHSPKHCRWRSNELVYG